LGIEKAAYFFADKLVFSPIIDSRYSNSLYRTITILSRLGKNKIHTSYSAIYQQARAADAVIVRSEHEFKRLSKGMGISERRLHIILNGTEIKAITNLSPKGSSILHVSAFTQERKNVLRLIKAVGPTKLPLIICGTGKKTDSEYARKLFIEAEKYPNIQIKGFVSLTELEDLYTNCQVFALPSLQEGTGLVALDAANFGANIVITKNGGTPDYFFSFAKMVNPYSVNAIKNAVLEQWEKPRTNRAIKYIQENLTWEKSAQALLEVYKSL
jgi:glycosyltransferase involved in cell wall biosynthesis